jgi:hypothetical protein
VVSAEESVGLQIRSELAVVTAWDAAGIVSVMAVLIAAAVVLAVEDVLAASCAACWAEVAAVDIPAA